MTKPGRWPSLRETLRWFWSRARDGGVRAFVARVEGEEHRFGAGIRETGDVRDAGGSAWDLDSWPLHLWTARRTARLESVAVTPVYWFAWSGFYPNTQVID